MSRVLLLSSAFCALCILCHVQAQEQPLPGPAAGAGEQADGGGGQGGGGEGGRARRGDAKGRMTASLLSSPHHRGGRWGG